MIRKIISIFLTIVMISAACFSACGGFKTDMEKPGTVTPGDMSLSMAKEDVVVLRICNWEEYIDEGGWDEDEAIELSEDCTIFGEDDMITDFEEWYYDTYGIRVEVEYSCFGTNEDLYNMLTLGDVYDLVCPSDYMIMKLMAEEALVPFSQGFFDETVENNYYIKGVSPYIRQIFDENEINGESWSRYAAGYMWGVTGILYNPDEVSSEEASTWSIINNQKYNRQITIKDNVRDSYFAALGAVKSDLLTDKDFLKSEDYQELLTQEMNDVRPETISQVQTYLQEVRDNVYSFETDSGKADMVSGKVLASYQWSGDAVYAMDQADEDDFRLEFAVPEECTNIYFDGWVMLKSGIVQDERKQHAAESFINFVSRPDNAIRNMYYIGYTSVISGGEDDSMFLYADSCYGADESEEAVEYPLGYFFSGDNSDEDYIIYVPVSENNRQVYAQYPSEDIIERSAVMGYFDEDANSRINRMWINVRCYNINDVPIWVWEALAALLLLMAVVFIRKKVKTEHRP